MTNKWLMYFVDLAIRTSYLSHAKRLKVGAIAVSNKRVICNGYNGTPPGTPNVCEEHVAGVLKTLDNVEHAERNLIYYAARTGIALENASLFVTAAPCVDCARAIHAAGFKEVYFLEQYKSTIGIDLLKSLGVVVYEINYESLCKEN